MNVLNRDDVQEAVYKSGNNWRIDPVIDMAMTYAMENGYYDDDFTYEDSDAEYSFECLKPTTYVYDEVGELDYGNDDEEYWLEWIKDKKTGEYIYYKRSPRYGEMFYDYNDDEVESSVLRERAYKKTKANRKPMRANTSERKGSPYPQGSVMDDAWLTWQQVLKGKKPPEITEKQISDMINDVVARHYPDWHPDSDAFVEKSLDIGTQLFLNEGVDLWAGINRKNTKASKVRAMYEALDGMGGESDYVSTGDIVDDDGYTYEIVSILDVKEDHGYEVVLAEAVNADRGTTEFLVLLNGDVDWRDDNMEAAREFYEDTDYSELDNMDDDMEDDEMEDIFDMYEADDDIIAAYHDSANKSDDDTESEKKRNRKMQAKQAAEMRKRVHASIEKSMRVAKNNDREKPVKILASATKGGKTAKWIVEIKANITEKGKRYSVQGVKQLAKAMGVSPSELDVAAMYEACKQDGYTALAIEDGKAKLGKVQSGWWRWQNETDIEFLKNAIAEMSRHESNWNFYTAREKREISPNGGLKALKEDIKFAKQRLEELQGEGANRSSKMQRMPRESRMNADYEGAHTLQEWFEKTGLDGADVYDRDFDLDGTYVDTIVTPADNYDRFVLYVCNNVEIEEGDVEDSYATVDFSGFVRNHMQVFLQWLDIDETYYRDGLEDDDLYEYIIDQIITALSGNGSESQYREFMRLVDAGENAQ